MKDVIREAMDAGYAQGVENAEARAVKRITELEKRLEDWESRAALWNGQYLPGHFFELLKPFEELEAEIKAWKEYAGRLREALEAQVNTDGHVGLCVGACTRGDNNPAERKCRAVLKALALPAPGTEEKK